MDRKMTQQEYMQSIMNLMARLEKDLKDPKLPAIEKKYLEGKFDSFQAQLSLLSRTTITPERSEPGTRE